MVDMVRKHTVEGTGNHRTIMGMVERSSEMLYMSKKMERSFVSYCEALCRDSMQCHHY